MKKMFAALLACSMVLVGCGPKETEKPAEDTMNIVMITDKGTIEDKSFNQGTWEGILAFEKENEGKVKADYIKPTDGTTQYYNEAIDQAVNKYKADVIVTPGFLFQASIFEKQDTYPDVKFILVDAVPSDCKDDPKTKEDESTYKTASNTVSILYSEEQSGYLAGYAAVKEGFTKLGFMGGFAVPAVVNFGYGYVQGANDAAKELNKTVDLRYVYTNSFTPLDTIQQQADAWYKNGTEVIFSCGGGIFANISAAAALNKTKVIGVDVDQAADSEAVVTSAMKQLAVSVQLQLKAIADGTFQGGKDLVLGAADDSVGLPMDTSRFEHFTKAEYDALYAKVKSGEIKVRNMSDKDIKSVTDLNPTNVKLALK